MGKSDQKRIGKTAEANAAAEQKNADTAFAGVGAGVNTFQTGVNKYQDWLNQTYGPGGTFLKTSDVLANDVSQASNASLGEDLAKDAERTGYNTANVPAVEAEAARRSARDMTSFRAKQQDEALTRLGAGNQFVVGEESKVPAMWESAYGTSVGGATGNLNVAQKAENQPPWWQTALNYAAEGGKDYAMMGCWIAEVLWSPQDIRTYLVRAWLNSRFMEQPGGRVIMFFYRRFGPGIAALAQRSELVRSLLHPLFTRALNQALAEIE